MTVQSSGQSSGRKIPRDPADDYGLSAIESRQAFGRVLLVP